MAPSRLIGRLASLLLLLTVSACSTVPITGRKQLNLIPISTMNSMSATEYGNFLSGAQLSTNAIQTDMVRRVGERVQAAVERYFTSKGMAGELSNYDWTFNLVEDPQLNAWCMPGGRVVVYTGILPVTQDENGLAVVMGHEIAHAIAGHGNERMSQGMIQQLGGVALDKALEQKPAETRGLWQGVYGISSTVGYMLPNSRNQESEADELGLIFMTMAGYDPHAAIPFWERMSAAAGGAAPPEFLSTHPSDATRIEHIRKLLPKALSYQNK
ncbi:MAG: M48 family metallopeptidase [Calditrichaeota bacterium]|nr:M48 family metallopeptidase [Candidatus Cloacimonadota bacterium]MCB1047120.1 M48 family metallopeptidase [Calditrichota bacterium]MCB9474871.1 M48 family metallopeptidase [Candidatus Delongbacteria bacterium]